jgi:hypothetical protein
MTVTPVISFECTNVVLRCLRNQGNANRVELKIQRAEKQENWVALRIRMAKNNI